MAAHQWILNRVQEDPQQAKMRMSRHCRLWSWRVVVSYSENFRMRYRVYSKFIPKLLTMEKKQCRLKIA
ncbi:hypothetical protein LAZ67_X000397 [Cordylochernes scorpioides]|uniref:Uncharacterized protein n=1 Tax=Cordylochernes scorpioides TaxID=51811 RepID=A0ABY6LRI7_9ARAC|nr:hypothetical protein LAZ67_X000397 [Cordylochernes scorpioides]